MDVPLLITHGNSVHLAPAEPLEALVGRIPTATYFEIPNARHLVLQESDEIRSTFWHRVDEFLP